MCCSQVLDQKGVGQLIKMATEKGRAANPNLKVSLISQYVVLRCVVKHRWSKQVT